MASRLQDVILRDTRANQPLATAVAPGTLYYVTDEEVTERSNGTAWESYTDAGGLAFINISAGTTSQNLTNLIFSNSNNVSFGLNGSTITASVSAGGGGEVQFYWANYQYPPGPNTNATGNSVIAGTQLVFQPMMLPYDLSANYARAIFSNSWSTTTFGATSANTSWSMSGVSSFAHVIYTLGTGGSTNSLMSHHSYSIEFRSSLSLTAGANGSEYSYGFGYSYPGGFGLSSTFSSSEAQTSANYNIFIGQSSQLTGIKFVDLPFSTTLPSGAYWLGFGFFSSRNIGNAPVNASVNNMIVREALYSAASNFTGADLFFSTDAQPNQAGQGFFTTGGQVMTTANRDLSAMSAHFNFRAVQFAAQTY